MKTTAEIIEILRDYKARSAEKYGIETLGLFGSVARGEQNEKSDIDVFIKLRKTSYYTLMDIKDDLEQVFRQQKNASTRSLSFTIHSDLMPVAIGLCPLKRNIEPGSSNIIGAEKRLFGSHM